MYFEKTFQNDSFRSRTPTPKKSRFPLGPRRTDANRRRWTQLDAGAHDDGRKIKRAEKKKIMVECLTLCNTGCVTCIWCFLLSFWYVGTRTRLHTPIKFNYTLHLSARARTRVIPRYPWIVMQWWFWDSIVTAWRYSFESSFSFYDYDKIHTRAYRNTHDSGALRVCEKREKVKTVWISKVTRSA